MTRDQWKLWEDSMSLAPDIVREMYTTRNISVSEMESLDLARTIRSAAAALNAATTPGANISPDDLMQVADITLNLVAGMYGRLMGLGRAYDEAVTKQTVLEAELATTGK
jgi:hypothetical protein